MANQCPLNYQQLREMFHDGLINFAVKIISSSLIANPWSIAAADGTPQELINDIKEYYAAFREKLYPKIVRNLYCYGWFCGEKLFRCDEEAKWSIREIKELLVDKTQVLVNPMSGQFSGVRNLTWSYQPWIQIDSRNLFYVSNPNEGAYWYSDPILLNAYTDWKDRNDLRKSFAKYNHRCAGGLLTLRFPPGSAIDPFTKQPISNRAAYQQMLNEAMAGDAIAYPGVDMGTLEANQGLDIKELRT